MESDVKIKDQLLSTAEKNAYDKKWYRMKADEIDSFHMELDSSINSVSITNGIYFGIFIFLLI